MAQFLIGISILLHRILHELFFDDHGLSTQVRGPIELLFVSPNETISKSSFINYILVTEETINDGIESSGPSADLGASHLETMLSGGTLSVSGLTTLISTIRKEGK